MIFRTLRLALLSAGAVAAWAATAPAQDAYVVGISAALTGRGSGTYAPVVEAIKIYLDRLNAKGGINGHPVKLVVQDNQAQPSRAGADAKKFVGQDDLILVMNASLSSTYAPMVAELRKAGMPLLFAGGVCPKEVFPPADKLQFCTTSYAADLDSEFAMHFVKEVEKRNVKLGFAAMSIPLSRAGINRAAEVAESLGMTTVDKENIPPPTPNYAPFATKLKDAGAEWVFSWAPWVTQIKTFEALRALGWQGKFLSYGHINAEEELARVKDDGFFVFGANAMFQDDLPIHREIRAAAKAAGAKFPATYLAEGWIAAMALEQVLSKVSWPPSRDKVIAAMNGIEIDLKGLRGASLKWTAENHFRTAMHHRVYRWDSGKRSVVRVKDWSEKIIK
ncbi:MAG: ABC transporter substrate-binding protein [Alphaproteobacteria bacterium]|nr:ABC transporter substrate-binding protein [Alphaproteobacteria bacterium]